MNYFTLKDPEISALRCAACETQPIKAVVMTQSDGGDSTWHLCIGCRFKLHTLLSPGDLIERIRSLRTTLTRVYENEGLGWDIKYPLIFMIWRESDPRITLDWYDPDMDYEDDVRAFMDAFQEKYGAV